ncbi:MAG: vitamin K epoxide reductase family protein [Anaerolineae bacterium]|nr:vitamin K epoxide reductase family protein [Anaerolineae bacterium]
MEKWMVRSSLVLIVIGLFVSVYMTIFKVTSNESMCLGSGDCSIVNASRYSEVYGIPVAAIGIVGYLALLLVHWFERRNDFMAINGPMIFFGLALTGFLFTLYLIYIEIAIIRAFCPFCITSQIAMSLIFFISLIRFVKQPDTLS